MHLRRSVFHVAGLFSYVYNASRSCAFITICNSCAADANFPLDMDVLHVSFFDDMAIKHNSRTLSANDSSHSISHAFRNVFRISSIHLYDKSFIRSLISRRRNIGELVLMHRYRRMDRKVSSLERPLSVSKVRAYKSCKVLSNIYR